MDAADLFSLREPPADRFVVEIVAGEVDLFIADPVGDQGIAAAAGDADHPLQGIVGISGDGEQRIPVFEDPAERDRQRVRAGHELNPHQRVLGPEDPRVDPLQLLPAGVGVAVAGHL